MTRQKRNLWDEIARRVRDVLHDLDRLMNPQPHKPVRVPVPIPVRQPMRPRGDERQR